MCFGQMYKRVELPMGSWELCIWKRCSSTDDDDDEGDNETKNKRKGKWILTNTIECTVSDIFLKFFAYMNWVNPHKNPLKYVVLSA